MPSGVLPSGILLVWFKRFVMEHHQPVAGHQQERAGGIVLEAHPARPFQPGGSLAERSVWRDLEEVRLQRSGDCRDRSRSAPCRRGPAGSAGRWAAPARQPNLTAAGRATGEAGFVGSCAACGAAWAGLQFGRVVGTVSTQPHHVAPGKPFVVEYSKCSASPGCTTPKIACAATAASLNPCRISLSFPG